MEYQTLDLKLEERVAWLTLDRPDALNASLDAGSLEQVIAMEDRNQILCAQSPDVAEGFRAFLEKRAPVYRET